MDDINKVIKTVKETVTVDNIVSLMKDVKVIDEKRLKEEDVRKTLSKMDINNYVDVEEIKKKAQDVAEQSKDTLKDLQSYMDVEEIKKKAQNVAEQSKETLKDIQQQSSKVITYAKDSFKEFNMFKVLSKAEVPPHSICANLPPPDIIEKQEYENMDSLSNKEIREEDSTKAEGQGKQYEAASPAMANLEVSALQMDDFQKTDL